MKELEMCRKNVINYVLILFLDFIYYLFVLSKISVYLSGRPSNRSYCSALVAVRVFLLFQIQAEKQCHTFVLMKCCSSSTVKTVSYSLSPIWLISLP